VLKLLRDDGIADGSCVVIRRLGILRVGTDDAEQLAAFIRRKMV